MKYRVRYINSPSYPYRVDRKRKSWHWWTEIGLCTSQESAKEWIKLDIKSKPPKFGAVVFQYDELDQVVDKLKG